MKIRLNKYLAAAGLCSRRSADELIRSGKVTVNGMTAELGAQVDEEDRITVNGRPIEKKIPDKVVLAYYKPVRVTCTEQDRHAEKALGEVFQKEIRYPIRVTYAGRLDKDSEGLLLMTNDGMLIEKMMRGNNRHEKEYVVKVDRDIKDDFLKKMSSGIYLKELEITTRPCEVSRAGTSSFRIVLTQGVNRQIRRMCQELGYQVKSLKRVRVVNIGLTRLKPGEYREIAGEELRILYRLCRLE